MEKVRIFHGFGRFSITRRTHRRIYMVIVKEYIFNTYLWFRDEELVITGGINRNYVY